MKKSSTKVKEVKEVKAEKKVKEVKAEKKETKLEIIVNRLIEAGDEGLWVSELQEITGQKSEKLVRQAVRKARFRLAAAGYTLYSIPTDPDQYEVDSTRIRIYKVSKTLKSIPKDESVRKYAIS